MTACFFIGPDFADFAPVDQDPRPGLVNGHFVTENPEAAVSEKDLLPECSGHAGEDFPGRLPFADMGPILVGGRDHPRKWAARKRASGEQPAGHGDRLLDLLRPRT